MPARLREIDPGTGVIMLGQYAQPSYALGLLEEAAGWRAYLLKERIGNKGDLIGAIETVAIGGSVIDPLVLDVLIKARSRPAHSRISQLTPGSARSWRRSPPAAAFGRSGIPSHRGKAPSSST
jgi:DNA-binding NarL/FixJ family response regulator